MRKFPGVLALFALAAFSAPLSAPAQTAAPLAVQSFTPTGMLVLPTASPTQSFTIVVTGTGFGPATTATVSSPAINGTIPIAVDGSRTHATLTLPATWALQPANLSIVLANPPPATSVSIVFAVTAVPRTIAAPPSAQPPPQVGQTGGSLTSGSSAFSGGTPVAANVSTPKSLGPASTFSCQAVRNVMDQDPGQPLTLLAISPTSVLGGKNVPVTLTGKNFTAATSLILANKPLAMTYVNPETLIANIPRAWMNGVASLTGSIHDELGGCGMFVVQVISPPVLQTAILTHTSMNSGIVTITGSNFTRGAVISIVRMGALTTTFVSSTKLTAVVTTLPQIGWGVSVTNPGPPVGTSNVAELH
jgi:hypothetical protein